MLNVVGGKKKLCKVAGRARELFCQARNWFSFSKPVCPELSSVLSVHLV